MTLRDRLIGGVVDGLMIAIDTITSFWQTPREVEWAKAAADGLADREAEEEVSEPTIRYFDRAWNEVPVPPEFGGNPKTPAVTPRTAASGPAEGDAPRPPSAVVDEDHRGYYTTPTCALVNATWTGGQPGCWHACYRDPGHVGDAHHCLCGYEWENFARPSAESPAPEFDWVTTAIPVIAGVLAEHVPDEAINGVDCIGHGETHGEFADWRDWRDHVAPHIASALQTPRTATVYDFPSGDRPRPLADFPKHQ